MWETVQDGSIERPWSHYRYISSTAVYKTLPSEKDLKPSWMASPQWRIKRPYQDGYVMQRWGLTRNSTPCVVTHKQEGSHKYGSYPWRAKILSLTSGTLSLGPALKRWVPKTSGSENQWGNPKGYRKLRVVFQRACADSPVLDLNTKAKVEKCLEYMWKRFMG